MSLEKDKWYKTRDGKRARVLCTDATNGKWPVVGYVVFALDDVALCAWTTNGRFHNDVTEDRHDLQEEWISKPFIDWSREQPWVKAIAMDNHSRWWRFQSIPILHGQVWDDGEWSQIMHPSEHPKWTGDWKDSLTIRPS